MILIFGGAYQGKREFAKAQFGVQAIHDCGAAANVQVEGGDAAMSSPVQVAGDAAVMSSSAQAVGDAAVISNYAQAMDADPGVASFATAAGDAAGLKVPDFSKAAVCGLERFTWECCGEDPQSRIEAADWMRQNQALWQDKILIITDVSQGIVPMDARTRAFREMNGRLMLYLASEADEVWRVFCGIGKRIK